MKDKLTVTQTAKELGYSRNYTYQLIKAGKIPIIRVFGRIYVDPAWVLSIREGSGGKLS